MIVSVKLPIEVCRLSTSFGSKSPLRSRAVSISTSPKSPRTVFGDAAIPRIAAAPALERIAGITEVLFHLHLEEGLQSLLDQTLHDGFGIHCRRAAAGADLGNQYF